MKCLAIVTWLGTSVGVAQAPAVASRSVNPATASQSAYLTVRSNLVVVPALVRNASAELVYSLQAKDFILTDNGVEQTLRLEENPGDQPIALVVCVQTGNFGREHLDDYHDLTALLENLVGGVEHTVAVVGFDSTPTVLHGFTSNLSFVAASLNNLDAGDQGAAILDGLTTAVDLLRRQPPTYRRAVLLLSETFDQGSHIPLTDALRLISDSNTIIYSAAFSTSKADIVHEVNKSGCRPWCPPLPPGPKHGCFSRDLGTDANGNPIKPEESRAAQNFNCIEELLPPLRLAKLAELGERDSLRQNVSESVAKLTGGEAFTFRDAKSLQRDLFTISNRVANHYVLEFHPQSPVAGFHAIVLRLRDRPKLLVDARNGYWVEDPHATAVTPEP